MGIGMSSDDAFTANALADVNTDSDFPMGGWLWRDMVMVMDETLGSGVTPYIEVRVDLRAQRKLDRASVFLARSNTAQEGTNFSVEMTAFIRMLYKLP